MLENFLETTKYVQNNYLQNYKKIKELKEYALSLNIPIVTDDVLSFIIFLLKLTNAKQVLELGSAIGYSGFVISNTLLLQNGNLDTVEIDTNRYLIAKQVLKDVNNVTLYNMDALEYLKSTTKTYDIIFIDASKGNYEKFVEKSYKLLKNNGILIIDNLLFRSLVGVEHNNKKYKNMTNKLKILVDKMLQDKNATVLPFGDGVGLIRKE